MELQTLGKRATSSGPAANKRPNRNSTPQPPRAKSKPKSIPPGDDTKVAQAPVVPAKPPTTIAAQSRELSAAGARQEAKAAAKASAKGAQHFDIAGSREGSRAPSTGKSRSRGKSVPPVKEIAAAVATVVKALEASGSGDAPAAVAEVKSALKPAEAKAVLKQPALKKVLEPKKAPKKALAVPGTRKTRQKQSFAKEYKEKVPAVRMKSGKITVDRAALRAKITRISSGIAAAPAKPGRGRPPGSLNKKTLLAREALQAQAVA
jgi:hypothetical protein